MMLEMLLIAALAGSLGPEAPDRLLLAGGSLPLCSSISQDACAGKVPAGRRDAPAAFVAAADGQREREVVDFAGSKSADSKAIYLHFVAMAQAAASVRTGKVVRRPKIGIITASSEDPFDPVDFYLDAFTQAGAEAVWLPLDAAVRESFGRDCGAIGAVRERITGAADRGPIYPDLNDRQRAFCLDRAQLVQMLDSLDGLFFNGGDQTLTKAAWFDKERPIPEFARLVARVGAGSLAIGGTSAGTAVMSSGVMITSGESKTALRRGAKASAPPPVGCERKRSCPKGLQESDLTFDSSGGLGLFPLGVLDTHFGARDRQGRLAKLLIDSKTRFGFGVDETTALLLAVSVEGLRLRAIGAGQVWIYDANGQRNAAALADDGRALKPGVTLPWPN